MGIYFDNRIYGVRIVSFDGKVLLYEFTSNTELTQDQIKTAKTYIVDGVSIYVYSEASTTYENPAKIAYLWRCVGELRSPITPP